MKKLILLAGLLVLLSYTHAQKISAGKVPDVVKAALSKNYPNAKAVKWEKEKANYEAEFKLNEVEYSILVDVAGSILETETEMQVAELLASIKEYVAKHHPNKKIKEAAKIVNNKGIITYEVEIKGKDLLFDSNGNFIK